MYVCMHVQCEKSQVWPIPLLWREDSCSNCPTKVQENQAQFFATKNDMYLLRDGVACFHFLFLLFTIGIWLQWIKSVRKMKRKSMGEKWGANVTIGPV